MREFAQAEADILSKFENQVLFWVHDSGKRCVQISTSNLCVLGWVGNVAPELARGLVGYEILT